MSVSERCRTLRSRIAERSKLLRSHQDAETIRARVQDFAQLRLALQLRIQQRAILAQHSVASDKVRNPEQLVEMLEDSARQLSQDYDEASRQLGKLKRALGTFSSHLTSVVTKAVEAERDAILNGNDPLSSPDALKHFLQHLGSLKAASDALDPNEFPKDVLKFFKGARHGGARLDDFTPAVREWLAEQNLLKHVRVSIVS
jgi:hypothetical protein